MLILNKKDFTSNLLFLCPAIIWMCIITYLSSQEHLPDVQELFKNADKVAHFGVYFILSILLMIGISSNFRIKRELSIFFVFIIGSGFAALDEYHQSFVPNRTPDFYDLIADVIGIILGVILYKYIVRIVSKIPFFKKL